MVADYAEERDLDWAATRIAAFGTYQAGQSCIGFRVYADTTVYDDLRDRVVKAVGALRTGDPADPAASGPMIDEAAARRVESWVQEAVEAGARLLAGGTREGATYAPTVLEDVPADARR